MSCGSAGLPISFDRFREVWDLDFEYRLDDNYLPVPVALFAKEHRTGTEIAMRREQLLSTTRLPFDDGADVVATSYSAVAELGCCLQLRWPFPRNVLCTYFETSAQINGLDIVGLGLKRPSLLEACELFDIPHMEKEHKAHVRDIILNNIDYTEEQWQEIADYNRGDGLHDIPLFAALAVQSRSVVESAMLMLHSGRPYGTDSSRQRQDHARRPSCYTAIEGFDPRAR